MNDVVLKLKVLQLVLLLLKFYQPRTQLTFAASLALTVLLLALIMS